MGTYNVPHVHPNVKILSLIRIIHLFCPLHIPSSFVSGMEHIIPAFHQPIRHQTVHMTWRPNVKQEGQRVTLVISLGFWT